MKQEKIQRAQSNEFTGYPVGFKPLDNIQKEKLRQNPKSVKSV
jgi:hypothetical protein